MKEASVNASLQTGIKWRSLQSLLIKFMRNSSVQDLHLNLEDVVSVAYMNLLATCMHVCSVVYAPSLSKRRPPSFRPLLLSQQLLIHLPESTGGLVHFTRH